MINNKIILILIFCLLILNALVPVYSDIYTELKLGYGFPSRYQYFNSENTGLTSYLDFDATYLPCGTLKIGVNILKDNLVFGFYTGFQKTYDIMEFDNDILRNTGMIFSIPLFGYIENKTGQFFYEAGCGSFLTRINIETDSYSEYTVVSIFGFLLGAGYELKINRDMALKLGTEIMISSPGNSLFNHLPEAYKDQFSESGEEDILIYSDPANITYSLKLCISFEYSFVKDFKVF